MLVLPYILMTSELWKIVFLIGKTMIFEKCGFDTKSYFFLCFAALQNACFCLCLDRRKSVENARFPKNRKNAKGQQNKIRQSYVLPGGVLFGIFGILVSILVGIYGGYIYIYIIVWSVMWS